MTCVKAAAGFAGARSRALTSSLDPTSGAVGDEAASIKRLRKGEFSMTLKLYPALACWETAQALGWVGLLDLEILALFNRVIGTLVRLIQPRRSRG